MEPTIWYPAALLEGKATKPYGIIVLNQPINKNGLDALIGAAALLVCADAGANRLMDYEQDKRTEQRLPDAIIGDLDSISQDAQQYYSDKGVEIVKDSDQYSTDFTKSLKWMRQQWDKQKGSKEPLDVVVLGGLGGRVDQGFSQIHHLYMVLSQPDLLRGFVYLLSEQSLSFVLADGKNELHVNDQVFTENVGILPWLGPTSISITGFEWDVSDWPTEVGKQVSTSNHIRSDTVTVTVHGTCPLFTVELTKALCAEDSRLSTASKQI